MRKQTEKRQARLARHGLAVGASDVGRDGAVFDIIGPTRLSGAWKRKVAESIADIAGVRRIAWPEKTKVQLMVEVLADKSAIAAKYGLEKNVSKPWSSYAVPVSALAEAIAVGPELRRRAKLAGLAITGFVMRVIIPPRGEIVTGRGTLKRKSKGRK